MTSDTDADLDVFSARRVATDHSVSLDPARTAVLVVDMLNDFCTDGGAMVLPGAERLYDPINRLTDAARQAGSTVIWVCDRHDSLDDAEFRKRSPHCMASTWGAAVVDELVQAPDDVESVKTRYSAFYDSDLDQILADRNITTLVICGVVTNICVRSTTHDAFFRGYDVYVPEETCAATGEREQASSLYDIDTHFGTVTDIDHVLDAFAKGAKHE